MVQTMKFLTVQSSTIFISIPFGHSLLFLMPLSYGSFLNVKAQKWLLTFQNYIKFKALFQGSPSYVLDEHEGKVKVLDLVYSRRETRDKQPLGRDPDRSQCHRQTSVKLYWSQLMTPGHRRQITSMLSLMPMEP